MSDAPLSGCALFSIFPSQNPSRALIYVMVVKKEGKGPPKAERVCHAPPLASAFEARLPSSGSNQADLHPGGGDEHRRARPRVVRSLQWRGEAKTA